MKCDSVLEQILACAIELIGCAQVSGDFDLGILTEKGDGTLAALLRDHEEWLLHRTGAKSITWHHDGLRATHAVLGEELVLSVRQSN